jgi:hypothetical protein
MWQYSLSTKVFLLILAMFLLLLVPGCGGDGGNNTSEDDAGGRGKGLQELKGPILVTAGSATKAQFLRRADAICRAIAQKALHADEEYARAQIDRLSVIGAPSGDGHKIAAMLEALRHGVDRAEARSEELFQPSNELLAKAARLGEAYGFKHCGRLI